MIHHRAKLTDQQVRDMRQRHLAYIVGYETLAKEFGCSISTARDICTYRTRINVVMHIKFDKMSHEKI